MSVLLKTLCSFDDIGSMTSVSTSSIAKTAWGVLVYANFLVRCSIIGLAGYAGFVLGGTLAAVGVAVAVVALLASVVAKADYRAGGWMAAPLAVILQPVLVVLACHSLVLLAGTSTAISIVVATVFTYVVINIVIKALD